MRNLVAILILFVFFGYEINAQCDALTGNVPDSNEYILVWADEFDSDGSICADNWFAQTQIPDGGSWYNGERQHYTNRMENAEVINGLLKITAKKEQFTDQNVTKNYTSARLNSKFAFRYGRVDVRAKLPSGNGTWPAIWTLGRNINEPGAYWFDQYGSVNWPACGEIDIMEHWGYDPNVIHGSTHTPSSSGATVNTKKTVINNVSSQFHEYSIIWEVDQIEFLVDDVSFYTYKPNQLNDQTWPFDKPQYILLNIAMGGVGGEIDPNFTESSMEIDYVRVYQKEDTTSPAEDEPQTASEMPTQESDCVISLFSEAYDDVTVDTWRTDWSSASYESVTVEGSSIKQYSNLGFVGIETISNQLDIREMTHFSFDLWTPNNTELKVKLVDFGAVGAFGGGDDVEHELVLSFPNQSEWVQFDLPLSNFTSLTTKENISQLIFSDNSNSQSTIFLDNIYFYIETSTKSTNANLSSIEINGTDFEDFTNEKLYYDVILTPEASIPVVSATKEHEKATLEIFQAASIPGQAMIIVNAQNSEVKKIYQINFEFENVLSLHQPLKVEIYPNSSTSVLKFKYPKSDNSLDIQISDMNGKIYQPNWSTNSNNLIEVLIDDLKQGMYLLVLTENGRSKSVKFLKNR